jgi:hypothetical protein
MTGIRLGAGAAGLCQETVPPAPVALKQNEQTAMKLTDETAGQRALRVESREVRAGNQNIMPDQHTGRGRGIRTREGLPPTRFPSVRPRPLGESSAE